MNKLVVELVVFAFSLGVFSLAVSIWFAVNPTEFTVCGVPKDKPTLVAAVDPKTGELFAIPTIQRVCVGVKTDVNPK